MSSTHPRINPGRLVALVDYKWRTDRLPFEDIVVPIEDLPDPDADHGALTTFGGSGFNAGSGVVGSGRFQQQETLKDIERKWTDLALYRIHRGSPGGGIPAVPRTSGNTSTRTATTTTTAQGTSSTSVASGSATGH